MANILPLKQNSVFARAKARYQERAATRRPVRIGFLIDATSSREDTWELAQTIQARMFKAVHGLGALSIRLVHFGGVELSDLGWSTDPQEAAAHMAGVRCVMGLTQIMPGLMKFLQDGPETRADAVILIGDCFEEDTKVARDVGSLLKQKGIKVFSFLEGDDMTASYVFEKLAVDTGGKFVQFGDDMPLADLCEGVALLTSGGKKALARLTNERAKQLLLTAPKE